MTDKLREELEFRKAKIAEMTIQTREDERKARRARSRSADEQAFWDETAAVISEAENVEARALVDEYEAGEEEEAVIEDWEIWRRSQLADPESADFWDGAIDIATQPADLEELNELFEEADEATRRRAAIRRGERP